MARVAVSVSPQIQTIQVALVCAPHTIPRCTISRLCIYEYENELMSGRRTFAQVSARGGPVLLLALLLLVVVRNGVAGDLARALAAAVFVRVRKIRPPVSDRARDERRVVRGARLERARRHRVRQKLCERAGGRPGTHEVVGGRCGGRGGDAGADVHEEVPGISLDLASLASTKSRAMREF